MADVVLRKLEAERGVLPPVCMRCGAPATQQETVTLIFYPVWVWICFVFGICPGVLMTVIGADRITLQAPLCDQHKDHLAWRGPIWLLFGLALFLVIVATVLWGERILPSVVQLGLFLLLPAWLVLMYGFQTTGIHPTEVYRDGFKLAGVAEDFITALQEARTERARRAQEKLEPQTRSASSDDRIFSPQRPPSTSNPAPDDRIFDSRTPHPP